MFTLEENKKIGCHLAELIDKNFKSHRQFCKTYIEADGRTANQEETIKMANRLSQIINGKKAIQTYDLPIFSKLLNVSCEEILSAGTYFVPMTNRLTNYSIALSNDKNLWKEYMTLDDKLILYSDEYRKTVIDYALEFKNFEFLKYLMENEFIYFVDADEKNYSATFGAGTKIESKPFNENELFYKLAQNDKLRMQMISLAIEHNDIEILNQLHAREIPPLYQACYLSYTVPDCNKYYDKNLIIHIANADEQILSYFSKEFEITNSFKHTNTFLFPYMTNLINLLIKNKNKYLKSLLKCSIEHNRNTYNKLNELITDALNSFTNKYYCENDIKKYIIKQFEFYENGSIVCFRYINFNTKDGIITNIICADEQSNDNEINILIQELNDLYNKIRRMNS